MSAVDQLYAELRPAAFGVAYRMLGSVSEAEDVVQEAFLRLHRALEEDDAAIASPRAYVMTVVTRLAIDELRSARVRRERYVGEWLPEPLVDADPAREVEVADDVSLAMLTLLERLSPEQRAAFVLREAFDYPYEDIATVVGKRPDNARQLVTRARAHVERDRPRFEASRHERDRLADRFFAAVQEGDLASLETMLAEDVELHGDGGGKVPALARMLQGRSRVARTLRAWAGVVARSGVAITARRVLVNGQPGLLTLDADGGVVNVMAVDIADGRVRAVRSVVNPDKLRHLGPVGDVRALMPGRG